MLEPKKENSKHQAAADLGIIYGWEGEQLKYGEENIYNYLKDACRIVCETRSLLVLGALRQHLLNYKINFATAKSDVKLLPQNSFIIFFDVKIIELLTFPLKLTVILKFAIDVTLNCDVIGVIVRGRSRCSRLREVDKPGSV